MIAAILAGGKGVRLWPESRSQHPKQMCKLIKDRTMLDHTINRLIGTGCDRIVIITSDDLLESIQSLVDQRPDRHLIDILSEPQGKNTAPAVGMVLSRYADCKDEILGIFPADHHILDEEVFSECLHKAVLAANCGHIVTIGIEPNRPETGFGYIEKTKYEIGAIGHVYQVNAFHEKPDPQSARAYLQRGSFLWNAGIYMGKISILLEEFQKFLPAIYSLIETGYNNYKQSYADLPSISLDHGIAEKSERMAVVSADFGWCDLGSWNAFSEVYQPDGDNNVCAGEDIVPVDSKNCIIKQADKSIVLFGVQNLVVVETEDVIMVADLDKCQDIRTLTDILKKMGREDLL